MNDNENEIYVYTFWDLLEIAWDIFSKNFLNIVLIIATFSVPSYLMSELIPDDLITFDYQYLSDLDFQHFLSGIIQGTLMLLADIGIIYLTINTLEGKKSDYNSLLAKGISCFPPMFLTNLILFLFLIGLAIMLFIPAIVFGVYWVFALIVVVYKGKNGLDALKESKDLVEGKWWLIFFYSIIVGLLVSVASLLIEGALTSLTLFNDELSNFILSLVINFISYLIPTLSIIFFTILYYNLNQLKDNFGNITTNS